MEIVSGDVASQKTNMAADDIHVRLCLQEIVKLELEAKAIIQVSSMILIR